MQEINDTAQANEENTHEQDTIIITKKMKNNPPSMSQFDQDTIQVKELTISEDNFESIKEKDEEKDKDKENDL